MKAIVLLLMCIVYLSLTGQSVDYLAGKGALQISGYEVGFLADPGDVFSVRLLQERATELPPMLADPKERRHRNFFTPLSIRGGAAVYCKCQRGSLPGYCQHTASIGEEAAAGVGRIPFSRPVAGQSAKVLYRIFSAGTIRQISRCVRLTDGRGEEVLLPFLKLGEELWDPSRQRVTIWFDPGRIKRELIPNRKLGPPLKAGRTYHLVVDSSLMAANGLTLIKTFRKTFATTDSDRVKPSPADWQFDLPTAGTDYPFKVFFPEPMDYALLHSGMAVLNPDGTPVNGSTGITARETVWYFTPNEPWKDGTYTLRVSTRLEDLAGNNLKRLFDTDAGENTANTYPSSYVDLPVSILPDIE